MIKEILKLRICQNSEEDKLGKVLDNTFKISAAGVLTGGIISTISTLILFFL